MQSKRQQILEILKEKKEATVGELAKALKITSVTVRHHLDILRAEELVNAPEIRHRSSVGRPEYIYTLSEKAAEHFPKNYAGLTGELVAELKEQLSHNQIERIFRQVAHRIAAPTLPELDHLALPDRLTVVVNFLNSKGYMADWEETDAGFVVRTKNCPYEAISSEHPELCVTDAELITVLVGGPTQRICHLQSGDESCAYLITPLIPANLPEMAHIGE